MSDEINMTISIPTDDDGYVLLQCEVERWVQKRYWIW